MIDHRPLSGPSGVYVDGRLVADRYHRPLTVIQDPENGDRVWVRDDGREYWREKATVTDGGVDLDRINNLLRERPHIPGIGWEPAAVLVAMITGWLILAVTIFAIFAKAVAT